MNVIDHLGYRFLTAINNNLWAAWLMFIIAAVVFWAIRGFLFPPRRSSELSELSYSSPEENFTATEATVPAPLTLTTSYCELESEGSPKGKFSVYYKDELTGTDDGGKCDGGCNGFGGAAAEREELGWCGDTWEKGTVVRMVDMGWYRCQDLKVLDGSVVRLWDCRRRGVSAAALVVDGGVGW